MQAPASQLALALAHTPCHRWRNGKVRFRPPGEVFNTRTCDVVELSESEAKNFCISHHYSKTYPAAAYRVGIVIKPPFAREYLGGTAIFSVPMTDAVITRWLGLDDPRSGLELGRLVLLDSLETNAESFFIGKAFRMLRSAKPNVRGIVAYCDPMERRDVSGRIIKFSHSGVVYHATNACLVGRSASRQHLVTPNGTVVSPRALSKLANDERGASYVLNQLTSFGAPQRRRNETGRCYVQRLVEEAKFLKKIPHPGNFVFTWKFD